MADTQIIQEMQAALDALPANIKSQLLQQAPEETVDTVSIRFELVKFCSELRKHNQGVDWETNKQKPKAIEIESIIADSQRLFEFITG